MNSRSTIAPILALEPVISRYFETLNAGQFAATAALFAEEGLLYPPFAPLVQGRAAIATYLEQEAQGMKLLPQQVIELPAREDDPDAPSPAVDQRVGGTVQTSLFSVRVAWDFVLDRLTPDSLQIRSVRVNLLASLEELLTLR